MRVNPIEQTIWDVKPNDGYAIFTSHAEAKRHGVIEDACFDFQNKPRKRLYLVKLATRSTL